MRLPILFSLFVGLSLAGTTLFSKESLARDDLVVKQSQYGVSQTLDRLTKILQSKGITIFARIDHASGAVKIGKTLRPTQVLIFGNPKLGTPLMLTDQRIGLALPLKVLAFEDNNHKVWLSYRKAADLSKAYNITEHDKLFAKMSGVLAKLTDKAIN